MQSTVWDSNAFADLIVHSFYLINLLILNNSEKNGRFIANLESIKVTELNRRIDCDLIEF